MSNILVVRFRGGIQTGSCRIEPTIVTLLPALDAAFDLRERLEAANLHSGAARRQQLLLADESLANVRLYLRLAARWEWLSAGQYRHVSALVAEIGRLLGGWQKLFGKMPFSFRQARCGINHFPGSPNGV